MKIKSFIVVPHIPEALQPLQDLAYNLYFSWHSDVHNLFRKLDQTLWEQAQSNPVRMMNLLDQSKLDEAAEDKHFLAEMTSVHARFTEYLQAKTWYENQYGKPPQPTIAYFCAEFGLHESLPIYSGGLGVLAGDHIKSASDLGIPLVAVGLLYRQGYFHQFLNAEGMQQEAYPENDYYTMPLQQMKNNEGHPITVNVPMGEDQIKLHIWEVKAGRVCIYLLDTNLEENLPIYRDITRVLYDPDRETRIRQEIVLGIGGVRALKALGITPDLYHVNEGHSAFLTIERLMDLMNGSQLTFDQARELIWATTVFTTHTPVPAGNERFSRDLILKYMKDYVENNHISLKKFWLLGQDDPESDSGTFSMTVLALHFAAFCNGVSKLHGEVSRTMWQSLFPELPTDEIPIKHITNGVHAPTWLSTHMRNLFLRYATVDEIEDVSGEGWEFVDRVPDDELWELHEFMRRRLVHFVRRRIQRHMERRGAGAEELVHIQSVLNPKTLTLGFARRFATYKRGHLMFSQPERLRALLTNPQQPVQIVIAGKAHPADQAGKDMIKEIYALANTPEFRKHIVFVEDYDIEVGRYMVQGVDIWVNNPRRPLEASGTSGMKAALNGALNLSILDGWWDEAFHPGVGWPIGHGETYLDQKRQDEIEADLLYGTLERKIVPLFYDRDDQDTPLGWTTMMKASICELGGKFNSGRMLREYTENMYIPSQEVGARLREHQFEAVKALSTWRKHIEANWKDVHVAHVEASNGDAILKGADLSVQAWIKLGELSPDDVKIECIHGSLSGKNEFINSQRSPMDVVSHEGDSHLFKATIQCLDGGHYGYTVRVIPAHPNLAQKLIAGLMKWSE